MSEMDLDLPLPETAPLRTFLLFVILPTELRLLVYEHYLDDVRDHDIMICSPDLAGRLVSREILRKIPIGVRATTVKAVYISNSVVRYCARHKYHG